LLLSVDSEDAVCAVFVDVIDMGFAAISNGDFVREIDESFSDDV
jgi:hypothetical protein